MCLNATFSVCVQIAAIKCVLCCARVCVPCVCVHNK